MQIAGTGPGKDMFISGGGRVHPLNRRKGHDMGTDAVQLASFEGRDEVVLWVLLFP